MKNKFVVLGFAFMMLALFACTSNNSGPKYQSLLDQQWQNRKQIIVDSMEYNCQQKMAQQLNDDVSKILKKRGLK